MCTVAPVRLMPLLRRSSSTSPPSASSSASASHVAGLLRELLGPERLQLHGLDQLRVAGCPHRGARGPWIEVPQPPMDLADQDRQRRATGEQPLRESRPPHPRPARGDGVEERPRRARDRLRDQLLDVRAADLAVRAVERQLLQLAVGQLRLPPTVDVTLADVGPDPLRQRLRRTRAQADAELGGARAEPRLHPLAV